MSSNFSKTELIAHVPVYMSENGCKYICIKDIPEPWRDQFTLALRGSACPTILYKMDCAYALDWQNWVNGSWYDREPPIGLVG